MRAVLFDAPGGPEVLRLGDAPEPVVGAGEVLIEVAATAVNRADVMQRRGLYPPPPGASNILGLEVAGKIAALGREVANSHPTFSVGQPVMALLAGGGYAERVAAPAGQVLPIPRGLKIEQAAAIPEVFLTAYLNLFQLGGIRFGKEGAQSALIHGGASGVGTAGLSLLKAAGKTAYCTVGDDARAAECLRLGAHAAWNYKAGDWLAALLDATGGRGVDVVLDCIGASYLERNLQALATDGRLVNIGLMGGNRAELDMRLVLSKRAQIIGSTLRPLSLARKAALCRAFSDEVLPLFETFLLRPIIDRVLPLAEVATAHRALDEAHLGKIVLKV